MKCIRLKKFGAGVFSLLLILTVFMITVGAQTGSLAVWENIPDGVLTSDWWENEALWSVYNLSGTWVYRSSNSPSMTWNASTIGNRLYQTCLIQKGYNEDGDYCYQGHGVINSTEDEDVYNYYAILYHIDSAYLITGNSANPSHYWDASLSSWSSSITGKSLWGGAIYPYSWSRIKTIWNFNENNFTVRSKIWDVDDDEPVDWVVDETVTYYSTFNETLRHPGLVSNMLNDPGGGYGYYRNIMFWNLSWDTYEDTGIPYIACPTFGYDSFMALYENMTDIEDLWNATQLFKDFINTYDLISYYEERMYDPLIYGQNDTIYVFSQMFTDTREVFEGEYEPTEYMGEYPDNLLWLDFFIPPEHEESVTDQLLIRIDSDNNGVYDDYDYTIILWLDEMYIYNGTTNITDDVNWWGTHIKTVGSSPIKEVFRDYNYTRYWVLLNWDMFYNGSSGERIHDSLCRMSMYIVDGDTFTHSILQDWNITDDTNPKDPSDDYDIWTNMDPTLWLYFEVDESISGESMADPEDPELNGNGNGNGITPIDTDSIISAVNTFIQVIVAIIFIGIVFKLLGKIKF